MRHNITPYYIYSTMKEDNDQQNGPVVNLPDEVAKGTYSNMAVIAHSSSEFILDFLRIMPGLQRPEVESRIIMAPEHAKRLLAALQDNIDKYESTFGQIKVPTDMPMGPNITPRGMA